MKTKYLYILCLLFLMASRLEAQNYQWLKGYGTVRGQEEVIGNHAEGNNDNVIIINRFRTSVFILDTLRFGSFSFTTPPLGNHGVYVVRQDSNGRVKNAFSAGTFFGISSCRDDSGNFYIQGNVDDTFRKKVGPYTMTNSGGCLAIMKYDKNFNLKWARQYGTSATLGRKVVYSGGKVFFIADVIGKTQLGPSTLNLSNIYHTSAYGQINTYNGDIMWAKTLNTTLAVICDLVVLKNNIYVVGNMVAGNHVIISGDTLGDINGFVIRLDSAGNYKKGVSLRSKNWGWVLTVETDGEFLYFGGGFSDTTKLVNVKISPEYPNPGAFTSHEFFAASITDDLKNVRWFFRPRIVNKNKGSGIVYDCVYSDHFLYWGGVLTANVTINGTRYPTNNQDLMFFKTDLIGNVLWYNTGGGDLSGLAAMDAVAGKAVYAGGSFNGEIQLGSYRDTGLGNNDAWNVKLSDNAIIRGEVNKGPYCSGDTIPIPYIKIGDYDMSNYFVAELSDENGDFNGGEHILGKLKTNKNGVIPGRIPPFRVVSSGKYRIRILSTSPVVQSYYKVDTLKLLIYSRDKAYAGKDTTICNGDSVMLRTYGGTKWTWSPKYNIKSTTTSSTPAWPEKTTQYKIIIADSSGCGQADTAYKTIYVRKLPLVKMLLPKDTSVCTGSSMQMIASFHYGDSLGYTWDWVSIDALGNYTTLKSGAGKLKDTIIYKMPAGQKDSMQIAVFLNDHCSQRTALMIYTLKVSKTKAISSFSNQDTSFCPGKPSPVITKFSKGYAPGYNWQWQELNQSGQWIFGKTGSGKISDTLFYTLPQNWKGNKKIRVVLRDNCSALSDTAVYNIEPKDTLQLSLNSYDTTLCKGQSYQWFGRGKGGDSGAYQYTWTDNNGDTLSVTDSFPVHANTNTKVLVKMSDGCMPGAAVKSFDFKVRPELSAAISNQNKPIGDTTICYGQRLLVSSIVSGGKPANYAYAWYLDGKLSGHKDSLMLDIAPHVPDNGGTAVLRLILKDNCTLMPDTSSVNITILPKLSIQGSATDSICFKGQSVFLAKGSGGRTPYQYKWMDQNYAVQGNTDTLKVDYLVPAQTGVIKRFVQISDGCSAPDTIELNSVFRPALALKLSATDTCPLISTQLQAKADGGKTQDHTINWWQDNNLINSGRLLTQTATPAGKPALFKAVLSDGCSNASDTARIWIGIKPDVKLNIDKVSGCEPLLVTYGLTTTYKAQHTWNLLTGKGNDSLKDLQIATVQYSYSAGTYLPKLRIKTLFGCDNTVSGSTITVHPKPQADFSFINDRPTLENPEVELINSSTHASFYHWNIQGMNSSSEKEPKMHFNDTGLHSVQLIITSDKGCTDSIEKYIYVSPAFQVWMPDAFSPNGDGHNDMFTAFGAGIQSIKLTIYNRWGQEIFTTEKRSGWDGTYMGEPVQEGVYFYRLDAQGLIGRWEYINGSFTLLR